MTKKQIEKIDEKNLKMVLTYLKSNAIISLALRHDTQWLCQSKSEYAEVSKWS